MDYLQTVALPRKKNATWFFGNCEARSLEEGKLHSFYIVLHFIILFGKCLCIPQKSFRNICLNSYWPNYDYFFISKNKLLQFSPNCDIDGIFLCPPPLRYYGINYSHTVLLQLRTKVYGGVEEEETGGGGNTRDETFCTAYHSDSTSWYKQPLSLQAP